jgi:hypothetical protein
MCRKVLPDVKTTQGDLLNSRTTAALSILALAIGGVATAAPAQADVACSITNFSPRTVVVGVSPVTATFNVSTTGCYQEDWTLESDDFFVYKDSPQETLQPYFNSDAGPADVVVSAANSDYNTRERVFANGFSLKRRSVWSTNSFNASPEPVRKGQNISIKARLLIADWDNDRWVGYGGRSISVQFRTPTGSYTTVKTVTTKADGWVSTTVPAKQTGVWRVVYGGNSLASNAIAVGDSVQVNG